MGRCAVLIDVGYVYASGQVLCLDAQKPDRRLVTLDVAGLVDLLQTRATWACGEPYLRTYWYDGAARGIPTSEHQRVAMIDDVKVRLGRVNSYGQQKGVDALIYRDLMTLARERAVSHAYLVAGDGDLVEGVRMAQDLGVHVTLMYIQHGRRGGNVSPDLLQEVDRRIEFTRTDLGRYVWSNAAAESVPGYGPEVSNQVADAGRTYARTWLENAIPNNVAALVAAHPRIPARLDAELLAAGDAAAGTLRARADLRRVLRSAFWEVIRQQPGDGTKG